jgi:beta-galactosidase
VKKAPFPLEIKSFNFDWRFALGEQAGAQASAFEDDSWAKVDLPHDWAIAGPFGPKRDRGDTGKLPWKGQGWYRKHFRLQTANCGERLLLTFDGVMSDPKVYLNGKQVGSWTYGYNSFIVDASAAANFNGDNVLAVHADTRNHGSRWYPGAGIYRKVTARLVSPLHIPEWGLFVHTPQVSAETAQVQVELKLKNDLEQSGQATIRTQCLAPSGEQLFVQESPLDVAAQSHEQLEFSFKLSDPMLWDVEHPHLYSIVCEIYEGQDLLFSRSTNFGIRTFEWTVEDGFYLNGRRLQIKGVNLHHDHGPLGAAFYPRAMERQLEMMIEMGVNSIRTSHNPAAPELLDMCDRMGLIVYNELFDKYGPTAGVDCDHVDYVAQHAKAEVENFVLRDRNHACVCIWSIGNEIQPILENHAGKSAELVAKMVDYFREFDPTRPTSMGCHITMGAERKLGIFESLDTVGWNYAEKYTTFREQYPDKAVIYTESASAFGSRGAYRSQRPQHKNDWGGDGLCDANMLTSALWSDIPEFEFERMKTHPYVAGEYVWTGFDYLGEPTPYNDGSYHRHQEQAHSSYFGIVDLVGLPKDSYYLYRSHWLPEATTLHVAPHWDWRGHEGQVVPVTVYTNGDEVELFINGTSLGRKSKSEGEMDVTKELCLWKKATASSEEILQDEGGNVKEENYANKAVDGMPTTRWRPANQDEEQHWTVDLGSEESVDSVVILWDCDGEDVHFKLEGRAHGAEWVRLDQGVDHRDAFSSVRHLQQCVRELRVTLFADQKLKVGLVRFEAYAQSGNSEDYDPQSVYYGVLDKYRVRWEEVVYAPGELKAVAYRLGHVIAEAQVTTSAGPSALNVSADRQQIKADGMDLCYFTIEMIDANGQLCPLAMDEVHFEVEGELQWLGAGNGDPMAHRCFTGIKHPLFYGKAVAICRSSRRAGQGKLIARAEGLEPVKVEITCV